MGIYEQSIHVEGSTIIPKYSEVENYYSLEHHNMGFILIIEVRV